MFTDRMFRLARVWSNEQLARFAPLFEGDVVNVSAYQDADKQGGYYRDYFRNAHSYTTTNYKAEARGLQGNPGEIFLDLAAELPPELHRRFDVVFNHTTLEHVYDVQGAFRNLCLLSRDCVVVVVPVLQSCHTEYGDYWRISPLAIRRMMADNEFSLVHLDINRHRWSSVYAFAIGARDPEDWERRYGAGSVPMDQCGRVNGEHVGTHAIPNAAYRMAKLGGRVLRLPFKAWRKLLSS